MDKQTDIWNIFPQT